MFFLVIVGLFATNLETSKTVCEMAGNKSIDKIKQDLLLKVKLAGVEELYGENIFSQTLIENGKLLSDTIKSMAAGKVRIKGDPKFFNGKNLGEVCINATLYISEQDIKDFTPKKINIKNFCYSNPNIAIKDIKEKAKEAAFYEIISQYSPSLAKKISKEETAEYIHGFKIEKENFDFNKGAYCFDALATIIPYELKYKKPIKNDKNTNKTTTKNSDLPEYFENYIWEGEYRDGKIKAFYLDKKHKYFLIIFFSKFNDIYLNIYKVKKNNLKISGKIILWERFYHSSNNWSYFSGVLLNNSIFKGVFNNGDSVLILRKTNQRVNNYFTEVWKGTYSSVDFKDGKIYLLRNNEIKNFWADLYPTKDDRGSSTYHREIKNGVVSFYYISGYDKIYGKDYQPFNFIGTMIDKNNFIGAGTKDYVTKIELKRIK